MSVAISGSGTITGLTATGISAQPVFPGNILQVVEASTTTPTSTTTTIPYDNTIPQNTEGVELLTASIIPTSSTNYLYLFANLPIVDNNGINLVAAALFQDSTANALAVGDATMAGNNYPAGITVSHYMSAGTTSSTTFKLRFGPSGGTGYVNRSPSGNIYGSICKVRLVIMEIAA